MHYTYYSTEKDGEIDDDFHNIFSFSFSFLNSTKPLPTNHCHNSSIYSFIICVFSSIPNCSAMREQFPLLNTPPSKITIPCSSSSLIQASDCCQCSLYLSNALSSNNSNASLNNEHSLISTHCLRYLI